MAVIIIFTSELKLIKQTVNDRLSNKVFKTYYFFFCMNNVSSPEFYRDGQNRSPSPDFGDSDKSRKVMKGCEHGVSPTLNE